MVGLWLWTNLALADGPVTWSRDPSLLPWETLAALDDGSRQSARSLPEIEERRAAARSRLEGELSPTDRAKVLAEMGDLFRDEARLVLEADATDPWRVRLPTSPAWLQIEIALRWYGEALSTAPSADDEGRISLLRATLGTRVGASAGIEDPRPWRGTPYLEAARVAVADRDARDGDHTEARNGYRNVRDSKDLAAYAQYRLAGLLAAEGDGERARQLLQGIATDLRPGPFSAMLRDAARSALANHLASERPLLEVIPWIDEVCPPGDVACRRELRAAAAETWRRAGDARSEAWLKTMDAAEPLSGRTAARRALARQMVGGASPLDLLVAAEATCAEDTGAQVLLGCRGEMAFAVGSFYDQAGDPSGSWIQAYARLPRMDALPGLQREVARMVQSAAAPEVELARFDTLCDTGDAGCRSALHKHLRTVWSRLDRVHDAAWLHFVDSPPPLPGLSEVVAGQLVAERAPARVMLQRVDPECQATPACKDEVFPTLVGYFAATGMDDEAAWLIALDGVSQLPLSDAGRNALVGAAMRGDGGAAMARAVIRTCPERVVSCYESSRIAAEAFLRAARRPGEATDAARFGAISVRPIHPAGFAALVGIVLDEPPATKALASLQAACGTDATCAARSRAALAAWYTETGREADSHRVAWIDMPLDLGPWQPLEERLLRVLHTAEGPDEARARAVELCPTGSTTCREVLDQAAVRWFGATPP